MNKIRIKKEELGHYIVTENNSKEVRFFLVGKMIEGKFTGMMHDYCGGGIYQEALIVNDTFMPLHFEEDGCRSPTEWEDEVAMFESCTTLSIHELNTITGEFMTYDTAAFNYCVNESFMEHADTSGEQAVLIDGLSRLIPFGLGNTSFIDGYELESPASSIPLDEVEMFFSSLLKEEEVAA